MIKIAKYLNHNLTSWLDYYRRNIITKINPKDLGFENNKFNLFVCNSCGRAMRISTFFWRNYIKGRVDLFSCFFCYLKNKENE